jgi:hypothetical protein
MKSITFQQELAVSIKQLSAALENPSREVLGHASVGSISLLCPRKPVVDDLTKLVVKNRENHPIAVILCSPPAFPRLTDHYMYKTLEAQRVLEPELGHVVVAPLSTGQVKGLSYAILPYHRPLCDGTLRWYLQRAQLSGDMFKLLQRITELSYTPVTPPQVSKNFVKPLEHLTELEGLSTHCRTVVERALDRLENRDWQPCHILMHSDLWKGNLLLNQDVPRGQKNWWNKFVLIDWSGSMAQGYGIYDLIRLAQSMKLKPAALHKQLVAHCQSLGCEVEDARCHLVSALGYLALNLENFPFNRFVALADGCLSTLEQAYKDE